MKLVKFITELKKEREALHANLDMIAREATFAAIEAATNATPPVDDLSGTNTRSGELKAHWATDSSTEPEKRGRKRITRLANGISYASYVNDGHRMDRHFVPGLYINPYSDLLEYDPAYPGGITVGTKTTYVPGLFMAEKGEEAFKAAVEDLGRKVLEEIS